VQAAFGRDKKAVVADFVKPSATQKVAFWKLYDEYETQRKELGKQRIVLLQMYANHYFDFTSDQAMHGQSRSLYFRKDRRPDSCLLRKGESYF